MAHEYDMVVIGAGAAGLTAAGTSALLGAKTALVEQHRLGGDCTWIGCVPSKTLLNAANVAHLIRTANRFGIAAQAPDISFRAVMERVRQVRRSIYDDADAPPNMEKLGVEVIIGSARFLNAHAIDVRNASGATQRLTSKYFIIASGSRPKIPDFHARCLTNETLFELECQPERLLVLGAGPVGIEMAQALQRLGSAVTVVSESERILPRDEPEHTATLQESLAREGVSFRLGRRTVSLEGQPGELVAILADGRAVKCDAVLAAIGRKPNVEALGLENAGVAATRKGIETDRHCRTSQRHIYAAGDVTGRYQFTHMAEHMSKVAVMNAILHWPKKLDDEHIVWCTFTEPELAKVGESEADLHRREAKYGVYRFPFSKLDRAITDDSMLGEVKLLGTRSGRILGASILGVHAGEMITEFALAMRNGIRVQELADTIHPYPTYMLGDRRAADRFIQKRLDSPLLGLLGKIFGYRGIRKGSGAL